MGWDDDARQRDLLRQRAEQYAAPLKRRDETLADALTVLTFRLGAETYGVDVAAVRAVRQLPRVTVVPAVPAFYRGVVNLRGQIISVLDLTAFFDLPPDVDAGELIVVAAANLELGLLARHVEDVQTVPRSTLKPLDSIRWALGVTAEQLVVLDIQQLLMDERLIIGAAGDD
ncbi:MAG TPA: chemotaxis protein CheW [Aggregatilineales bacterium]|jgi:purine-binding chemotaxis protein CheW|nr:chemotaxis protein CheW [Aggregatilineales bacterium]